MGIKMKYKSLSLIQQNHHIYWIPNTWLPLIQTLKHEGSVVHDWLLLVILQNRQLSCHLSNIYLWDIPKSLREDFGFFYTLLPHETKMREHGDTEYLHEMTLQYQINTSRFAAKNYNEKRECPKFKIMWKTQTNNCNIRKRKVATLKYRGKQNHKQEDKRK